MTTVEQVVDPLLENYKKVAPGRAINNLRPGAQWVIRGNDYDGLVWEDETQTKPTKEEFEAELQRMYDEFNASKYKRDREFQYPDIRELADAIYWQSQGDNSKMEVYLAKVEAVKQQYPKPEAV